jgi:hypothetical protein
VAVHVLLGIFRFSRKVIAEKREFCFRCSGLVPTLVEGFYCKVIAEQKAFCFRCYGFVLFP